MDPKSFGIGFGAGAGVVGAIFGVIHLVKKRKEKKEADPGDVVNWPDPPAPPEQMPEEKSEEKEGGEEEDEVPDEHELFRGLSAPYVPPPPAERSMADSDIFEITEDDFFLAQGARKRFFTYYSGDGVMTDEGDEIIDDPIVYLGDSIYKYFADGGKNTINLRNNNIGCVIQVGAVPELYSSSHGGVAD